MIHYKVLLLTLVTEGFLGSIPRSKEESLARLRWSLLILFKIKHSDFLFPGKRFIFTYTKTINDMEKLTIDQMYLLDNPELYEWDYVENESGYSVRYDFRRNLSLWVHESGSLEGHAPKSLKTFIEENFKETEDLKFI